MKVQHIIAAAVGGAALIGGGIGVLISKRRTMKPPVRFRFP